MSSPNNAFVAEFWFSCLSKNKDSNSLADDAGRLDFLAALFFDIEGAGGFGVVASSLMYSMSVYSTPAASSISTYFSYEVRLLVKLYIYNKTQDFLTVSQLVFPIISSVSSSPSTDSVVMIESTRLSILFNNLISAVPFFPVCSYASLMLVAFFFTRRLLDIKIEVELYTYYYRNKRELQTSNRPSICSTAELFCKGHSSASCFFPLVVETNLMNIRKSSIYIY